VAKLPEYKKAERVMMRLESRIEALAYLGKHLQGTAIEEKIALAKLKNPWFTPENTKQSIKSIADNYLQKEALEKVVSNYQNLDREEPKKIGLVAAGNIPLVGIHDVISCFLSGHIAQIKLSEKDAVLIPYCIDTLVGKFPDAKPYFQFVHKLENFDAVIATGSNNTSRYFEYYFSKYPHIIRRNRNAIAVLSGNETEEQIAGLARDVFSYFGLGCRNVSKILVPKDYSLESLMQAFEPNKEIAYHNKYKNNLDYNAAIYLLNKEAHYISDFLVMRESEQIASRIACLHYQHYENVEQLNSYLSEHKEEIQCIVSDMDLEAATVSFGEAQRPAFLDYADGVDTLQFLESL